MNQHKHTEDLQQGRAWLDRAASLLAALQEKLDQQQPWPQDAALEFTRCAATVGAGFVALAHAERAAASAAEVSQVRQAILELSDAPLTAEQAHEQRERRAAAEARPHDNEPRFLGFTEHGHPVVDQLPPFAAAPCGGPASCAECADETGDLRRAAREAGRG